MYKNNLHNNSYIDNFGNNNHTFNKPEFNIFSNNLSSNFKFKDSSKFVIKKQDPSSELGFKFPENNKLNLKFENKEENGFNIKQEFKIYEKNKNEEKAIKYDLITKKNIFNDSIKVDNNHIIQFLKDKDVLFS